MDVIVIKQMAIVCENIILNGICVTHIKGEFWTSEVACVLMCTFVLVKSGHSSNKSENGSKGGTRGSRKEKGEERTRKCNWFKCSWLCLCFPFNLWS